MKEQNEFTEAGNLISQYRQSFMAVVPVAGYFYSNQSITLYGADSTFTVLNCLSDCRRRDRLADYVNIRHS